MTPPGRVAVVGLGAMGTQLAARLLVAGYDVVVWNRTAGKAEAMAGQGARAAASPAAAARMADTIIVMVSDATALRAVCEGADGLAGALRPGSLVVQMSTVGVPALGWLAAVMPAGAGLLDAPVIGSVDQAAAGTLQILAGGSPEWLDRARPLLSVLGDPIEVGGIGSGSAAKLVANSAMFSILGALGEALALGGRLGLDRETLYRVLAVTPLAEAAKRRRPAIESGRYPARFALALARKDADLAAAAAAAAGQATPIIQAARSWLCGAEASGWGSHDYTALLAQVLGAAPPEQDTP